MTDPVIIDSGPSPRGWSYYGTFLRCPMLFFWKYVYPRARSLGFNDTTPPLARGTIFHVGRAHRDARQWARENGKDENRVLSPIDAMNECARRIGPVGEERLPTVHAMFQAYCERYPYETFKIVAVEELMTINFGGALYTARLDRVCQDRDGKIRIQDTKTTARLDSGTLRKYTNHGQFYGHYFLGRNFYGDAFGGVTVDMAGEDLKFERKPPEPSPFMLRNFPALIETTHDRIEAARRQYGDDQDGWARLANPDEQTCYGKYGVCSCLELCRWGRTQ